ncbi:MAG: hypothetical protein ACKVW3_04505 [Phycisphaerales bacterium]
MSWAVAAFATAGAWAQPQWTPILLHPQGAFSSEVHALAPGFAGGQVRLAQSETRQPSLWTLGSPGWTSFGSFGTIYDMNATQQVGLFQGAMLWSGTAQSGVLLGPFGVPGVTASEAYAIAGDQQVGRAYINQEDHAALWRGSSSSFVDLTPAGAQSAIAYATDGTYQWGGAGYLGPQGLYGRALRWKGAANDTLDFTPPNALYCGVLGVGGGQQVGSVTFPGTPGHAVLWNNTPESWRDMHPFTIGTSILHATTGTAQVGWSNVPGFSSPQAGVWFGTPESFIRLSAFLPPGFGGESIATSIIEDGGRYIVGGFADGPNGQHHAFLWTRDIPAPGAIALLVPLAFASRRRR